MLRANLSSREARTGEPVAAAGALGATVSRDARAVESSANRDVMGAVTEVQSAMAMKEAARAYESGDRAGAQRVLQKQARDGEEAQARYALPQAQVDDLKGALGGFEDEVARYDAFSAEGKSARKARKSSARAFMK